MVNLYERQGRKAIGLRYMLLTDGLLKEEICMGILEHSNEKLQLEMDLRNALERKEFR
mgnify:CR=1 FL=1